MKNIDPILLQRLVDGELTLEQVQQMLKEADNCPRQWREIATALVEDQLWQQSVHRYTANLDVVAPVALNEPQLVARSAEDARSEFDSGEALPVDPATNPGFDPTPKSVKVQPPHQPAKGQEHGWAQWNHLMLAACLMLAIGVGYVINEMVRPSVDQRIANPDPANGNRDSALAVNAANSNRLPNSDSPRLNQQDDIASSQLTPAVYQPAYHLEVPDGGKLLNPTVDVGPVPPVPLYSVKNQEQLLSFQQEQRKYTQLSPELLQYLKQAGYHMQENIEFISGDVGEDQSFIVPVRTIRFRPRQ